MTENKNKKALTFINNYLVYILIIFACFCFFVFLYGFKILIPTNTDWLYSYYTIKDDFFYGMDITQHQIGWEGYRRADWQFPLGCFNTLSYPFKASIIYCDSIPLLAVIFKLFRFILPEKFQYFGIYGFFSMAMLGIMSCRILKDYINNKYALVMSSLLFSMSPIFLWRLFIHTALDSHWILLLALEPLIVNKEYTKKKIILHYSLVSFLCASIHIYLLLYCGMILVAYCIKDWVISKKISFSFVLISIYIVCAAFIIWILGGFINVVSVYKEGLRVYSMNLNSFFDSYGFSQFLPELKRYLYKNSERQFEGFAYLGAGVLILVIIGIIVLIYKRKVIKIPKQYLISLSFLVCIFFIVALSPTITLNDKVLLDISLPEFIEHLWGTFRATGRAAWVLVYTIMLTSIILISKIEKKYIVSIIVFLAVIIQFIDCHKLYVNIREFFYNDIEVKYTYSKFFPGSLWDSIDGNKDIKYMILANTTYPYDDEEVPMYNGVIYGGTNPGYYNSYQYGLADYANKRNLYFNFFKFSRNNYVASHNFVMNLLNSNENLNEYLFVFSYYNRMTAAVTGLNIYQQDDTFFAYSGELDERYYVPSNEIEFFREFAGYENDVCVIEGQHASLMDCWEIPAGEYLFKINTNAGQCVYPIFSGDGYDINYDIELLSEDENAVYYKVTFYNYDSQVGVYLCNSNDKSIELSRFSLKLYEK